MVIPMAKQCRLAILGTVVLLVTTLAPRPAGAQAEAAIRRLPIDEWCKAEADRDLEAKMNLFTSDAVLMPPGEPNLVGLQAIRAWHEAAWRQTSYQCSGTVDEVQVFGQWGFVRGTFSGVVTLSNGTPRRDSGKFINVVQLQTDGTWKIARAIWSVD